MWENNKWLGILKTYNFDSLIPAHEFAIRFHISQFV